MSFKRDGNDSGLLSVLQKRRIKDLLTESIPEDEAKLLANGRFCCLLCSSNPIFDTVNMLCVHRKGKKHKASVEYHEKRKEELRLLIAKRKHDQFLNTGSTSISVAQSHYSGISTASPYDSRVKRNKVKPGERKPRINLQQDPDDFDGSHPSTSEENNFYHDSISSPWQKICDQQLLQGPVKHDSKLKNIFSDRDDKNIPQRLYPYTPKHRKLDTETETKTDNNFSQSLGHSQGNLNTSSYSNNQVTFGERTKIISSNSCGSSLYPLPSMTAVSSSPQLPPPPPPTIPPSSSTISSKTCKKDSSSCSVAQQTTTDKSLSLKYRQLQGSGWKRDWDGKWIKDEEAEFDSDEEPPDLP